jgi:hypothetical protein
MSWPICAIGNIPALASICPYVSRRGIIRACNVW